jgi:hypothetical protein
VPLQVVASTVVERLFSLVALDLPTDPVG